MHVLNPNSSPDTSSYLYCSYVSICACGAYLLVIHHLLMSCRPGRLEVQVEISLPDENGRLQILHIHTNKMKENSFLAPDVNLPELGMCFSNS